MRGFMWCQSLCIYACVAVFSGSIEPTEFTAELHNYLMELEQEQEDHWSHAYFSATSYIILRLSSDGIAELAPRLRTRRRG